MAFGYRYCICSEWWGVYDHVETLDEALQYITRLFEDPKRCEDEDIICIFDRYAKIGNVQTRNFKKQIVNGKPDRILHSVEYKKEEPVNAQESNFRR